MKDKFMFDWLLLSKNLKVFCASFQFSARREFWNSSVDKTFLGSSSSVGARNVLEGRAINGPIKASTVSQKRKEKAKKKKEKSAGKKGR